MYHLQPHRSKGRCKTNYEICICNEKCQQPTYCSHILRVATNRNEVNDQESIQLPNTFRPRHLPSKTPKGKKSAIKARHHNQNTTSRNPKNGQTAIHIKNFTNFMQRHTMAEIVKHHRNTVLEQSVNFFPRGVGVS